MSRLRPHLTYANVMATVAVFVALGGGAYAAVQLPKNSVKAKQIAKSAVRSPEVKNRSLRRIDFRRGSLPAGERGPQGQPGPIGLTGQAGSPAASMIMGGISSGAVSEAPLLSTFYLPVGESSTIGGAAITPNATVVLRDLLVKLSSAPGPGASRTFGVGTSGKTLTCSISGTQTSCNSQGATTTLPPGTQLQFSIGNGNVAPDDTSVHFAYRAVTP
jgi:hypothetical protein